MRKKALSSFFLLFLFACNASSTQTKFLLAERFIEDKKYDAAISELQEVVDKAPSSELGQKAQLKIAQVQQYYLGRPKDAVESYGLFLKYNRDEKMQIEIEKIIADLDFQIFQDYNGAVAGYKKLLERNPTGPEAEHNTYNIGRALFFKAQFADAIKVYEYLKKKFPGGEYAKKADLEIANSMSSAGKCKDAIKQYGKVIQNGDSNQKVLATFGEALCYEEQDDLDKAYELLASIRGKYPTPNVVEVKMQKIKRRKILRKR